MGMNAEERESRTLLKEHCTFIRKAKHGDIWGIRGTDETIQAPSVDASTSEDWRLWRNVLAELKRKLREANLIPASNGNGHHEEDEEVREEARRRSDTARLKALGIHKQKRRKRVEIIQETEEYVLNVQAIAALLGIAGGASVTMSMGDVRLSGSDCINITAAVTREVEHDEEEE